MDNSSAALLSVSISEPAVFHTIEPLKPSGLEPQHSESDRDDD